MKIGITGGIGSGKSTLCRLFERRGIAVYCSDAEAKRLMTDDAALRAAVAGRFGAEVYADGSLDRALLAARVFSDPEALADLDALVHPAVMRDFAAWADRQSGPYVILESAILFDAGRIVNSAADGHAHLTQEQIDSLTDLFDTYLIDIMGIRVEAAGEDAAGAKAFEGAVDLLMEVRANAKAAKDWTTSDLIRDRLAALGFDVKDTRTGVEWSLK